MRFSRRLLGNPGFSPFTTLIERNIGTTEGPIISRTKSFRFLCAVGRDVWNRGEFRSTEHGECRKIFARQPVDPARTRLPFRARVHVRSMFRPKTASACSLRSADCLCLAVVLVFCQTGGHDFVNFDDDRYVYDNDHLKNGFTWDGCSTIPTTGIPIPIIRCRPIRICSIASCSGWGRRAPRDERVLHAITAVLLFLLVRQMTGRLWPSALVAALFAVHPLRVESVAWISERKDVLSGLFFVLTLGAYVRYVRAPPAAGRYGSSACSTPWGCWQSRCW